jgi:acyl-CoA dehydrogenase
VNYLMLTGFVCGGWQMARAAIRARAQVEAGTDIAFHKTKIATATFYAEQIMPKAVGLLGVIRSGASTAAAIQDEHL